MPALVLLAGPNGAGKTTFMSVVAGLLLALGFRGLFFPPVDSGAALLVWCTALLALTQPPFMQVCV